MWRSGVSGFRVPIPHMLSMFPKIVSELNALTSLLIPCVEAHQEDKRVENVK